MKSLTETYNNMRQYCITYDVKDSRKPESEECKNEIIKILSDAGAVGFESGIASAIVFKYSGIDAFGLNGEIKNALEEICYYYLICIADNSRPQIIKHENEDLKQNFEDSQKSTWID